jgi:hypothetical protein
MAAPVRRVIYVIYSLVRGEIRAFYVSLEKTVSEVDLEITS